MAGLIKGGKALVKGLLELATDADMANLDPRRMYHGTNREIDGFDPARFGQRDKGLLGLGVNMTSSPPMASQYATTAARRWGGEPTVMPLFSPKGQYKQFSYADKQRISQTYSPDDIARMTQEMIDQGYTGAELLDANGDIVERVVFDPSQVKSAMGRK